jgi:hypothetical protein
MVAVFVFVVRPMAFSRFSMMHCVAENEPIGSITGQCCWYMRMLLKEGDIFFQIVLLFILFLKVKYFSSHSMFANNKAEKAPTDI